MLESRITRRCLLRGALAAGASLIAGRAFAQERAPTSNNLTAKLNDKMAQLHRLGYLREHDEVRLTVHRSSDGTEHAGIGREEPTMAASLIKPFIMLAAYHRMKQGGHNSEIEKDIRRMIGASSNKATNRVLEFAGGVDEVQRIITDYGFTGTVLAEPIPSNSKAYNNKTTASDLNSFLSRVHNAELVDAEYSRRMLEHLDRYENPKGTYEGSRFIIEAKRHGLQLAGKTGFVYGLNGEAALVGFRRGRQTDHYNFVALIENKTMRGASTKKGRAWRDRTRVVLQQLFKVTHNHMASEISTG